jgi:hypothetical protein
MENFPVLVLALDFHYNLKVKFSQFHRTFLKGKMHGRRAGKWIGREDSAPLIAHKTNRILELLKSVDTECFADDESHYKCEGFFKMLIDFLEDQVQALPLPDLSESEEESFNWWNATASIKFNIVLYPPLKKR